MSAIDCEDTDEPVCPHCGAEFQVCEDWGWDAKNQADTNCPGCGQTYRTTVEYYATYTTEKLVREGGAK